MDKLDKLKELGKDMVVLYVEDDDVARDTMVRILSRFVTELIVAKDGQEGLELYLKHKDSIDFVMSDISMPRLNGIKLIEKIRESGGSTHCAIISAHNDVDNLVKAIELQVEYFLIKPVELDRLISVLEVVFGRIKDEEELKNARDMEQNRRLKSALDISLDLMLKAIPTPSVIIDKRDNIIHFNKHFLNLFCPIEDEESFSELTSRSLDLKRVSQSLRDRDSGIDWKDEIGELCCEQRVKIEFQTKELQEIFVVGISKIQKSSEDLDSDLYVVVFV